MGPSVLQLDGDQWDMLLNSTMYGRLVHYARPHMLRAVTNRLPAPYLRALSTSKPVQISAPPFEEPAAKDPSRTTYKTVTPDLHTYGSYLLSCLPKLIQQISIVRDELTLYVAPSALLPTLEFLRDHTNCQFKQLVDISGADYPSREQRFEIVYHLLSVRYASRIRVKTYANEVNGVPTATTLFNSANWYEREVWDLYGVWFVDHPDLRRILTDYGFEGHPLRKDFPLTGYTEVRYSEEHKRVVYEPLQLTQAFRNFESTSPWEMVGEGKPSARPEDLKLPPPPPPEKPAEQVKKDPAPPPKKSDAPQEKPAHA